MVTRTRNLFSSAMSCTDRTHCCNHEWCDSSWLSIYCWTNKLVCLTIDSSMVSVMNSRSEPWWSCSMCSSDAECTWEDRCCCQHHCYYSHHYILIVTTITSFPTITAITVTAITLVIVPIIFQTSLKVSDHYPQALECPYMSAHHPQCIIQCATAY